MTADMETSYTSSPGLMRTAAHEALGQPESKRVGQRPPGSADRRAKPPQQPASGTIVSWVMRPQSTYPEGIARPRRAPPDLQRPGRASPAAAVGRGAWSPPGSAAPDPLVAFRIIGTRTPLPGSAGRSIARGCLLFSVRAVEPSLPGCRASTSRSPTPSASGAVRPAQGLERDAGREWRRRPRSAKEVPLEGRRFPREPVRPAAGRPLAIGRPRGLLFLFDADLERPRNFLSSGVILTGRARSCRP